MIYRYRITPTSPVITPLMSDTFFGHFCWALRYHMGEDYLARLLDSYGNGKSAPVLFSSAFLSGYLPRPSMPSLGPARIKKFTSRHFGTTKKKLFYGLSTVKRWNKRRLVSVEQWLRLKDDYSEERLYEEFLKEKAHRDENVFEVEVGISNIISRVSGTVPEEGGGLFSREKIWYHDGVDLDLYVEVNQEEFGDLVKWFLIEYLPENGFGADKSVGMGSLLNVADEAFDADVFAVQEPTACLSLSLTSFEGIETYNAYYRLQTKFGKLGGSFATVSPTGGNPKPFKRPILMYEPGAVFFCTETLNDRPLLDGVHSDVRIRHCGIPITMPFRVGEDKYHAASPT